MQSLTRHLHAFLREVRLTEDEWNKRHRVPHRRRAHHRRQAPGVHPALRRPRRLDADHRGEQRSRTATPPKPRCSAPSSSRTPPKSRSAATSPAAPPAQPCWVEGTVTDTDGNPVPNARIEVWEADDDGFYDVQYGDGRVAGARAPLRRRATGATASGASPRPLPDPARRARRRDARSVRPLPDARLAPALHGHGAGTAHPRHAHLRRGDPQIEIGDTVFGVKDSLIKKFEQQPAGTPTPDGRDLGDQTWARTRFDIVLAPAEA